MTDFVSENTTPVNAMEKPAQEPIDHSKAYKIKLIESLIEHVKRENEFTEKFQELFGGIPGNSETSPYRFVEKLFADHIRLVAVLVGDSKEGLQWFLYDNDCGKYGLEAGIDEGETRKIKTIEDYLWLVDISKEI